MTDRSIARRSIAVLVAVIAFASGCGSGSGDPAATTGSVEVAGGEDQGVGSAGTVGGDRVGASTLRAAADRSVQAASVAFDYELSMTGVPGGPDGGLTMRGEGASDLAAGRAAMTIDLSDLVGAGSMEIVTDGTVAYLRMPLFAGLYGLDAGQWIRVDSGVDGAPAGTGGPDASAMLAYLQGAGGVEVLGREPIDGVETTHYAGQLSLADALEAAPDAERARLRSMLDQLDPTGTVDLAAGHGFEVWVGDDDLVRRVAVTMDVAAVSMDPSLPESEMVMTMGFRDYGAPVAIDVPTDWVDSDELPGF